MGLVGRVPRSVDAAAVTRTTLYWNPWAITGSIALVIGWVLAAVIFITDPRRLQNRALSAYLLFVSLAYGIGAGLMFASDDARTALAFQAVGMCAGVSAVPLYLVFLSTLPTRAMAWLRPRIVRLVLWCSPLLLIPLVLWNYHDMVTGTVEAPHASFDASFTGLGTLVFVGYQLVSTLFGLVAAIGVLRATKRGTASRHQAKWYAATFLLYDGLVLAGFAFGFAAFESDPPKLLLYTIGAAILLPTALLLFVCMLTYSILYAQLFDIDLRIKLAFNKGTIGAAFLVVFLIVSQLVQNLTTSTLGVVAGAVAAGILLFALRPIERVASRLADKAMPQTQDTDAYRDFRKMEVYKATIESFLVDGKLTERERSALDRLRGKLGIAQASALALESDLRAR